MSSIEALTGAVTAPLMLVLWLAIAALVLRRIGRRRAGAILFGGAAFLTYLFSTPLIGQALLRPLEMRFPPLAGTLPPVRYVVVLGSGYAPHDGIPVTAALDADGLVRTVEGVRLARGLPGAHLVVSGGARAGYLPVAIGDAQLARALGVAQEALIVSERPLNTNAEALEVARLIAGTPFLLVTSAYHMPRAMRLMRRAGTQPIAAPTGQRAYGETPLTLVDFLPGSAGLRDSELAIHEYLGLAAIAMSFE